MIRAMDQWLVPYLLRTRHRTGAGPLHVILAVCDHFEPFHDTDLDGALHTMKLWRERWPELSKHFHGSDGVSPRHTFFYPIEQYDPVVLDELSEICRRSGSEIEVHLHHRDDTAAGLEEKLSDGIRQLVSHGCLPLDRSGARRFGFVHGNWALDDSDPNGLNCGVADELGVLRRMGCYADFTMPSAPHGTQTRTVNSVYYAQDTPARKSHNTGFPVQAGSRAAARDRLDLLLMVQGPLGLNWRWRKWGVIPRIENAELSGANPPTTGRLTLWIEIAPRIENGPPWVFVKLHTHGGMERNYSTLLGEPMKRFYADVETQLRQAPEFRLHYATAREMVNMIHAAEDGHGGDPADYRDYLLRLAP